MIQPRWVSGAFMLAMADMLMLTAGVNWSNTTECLTIFGIGLLFQFFSFPLLFGRFSDHDPD